MLRGICTLNELILVDYCLQLGLVGGGTTHVLTSHTNLGTSHDHGNHARDDDPGQDNQPIDPHQLSQTSKIDGTKTTDTIGERENDTDTEETRHDDPIQDTTRGSKHENHQHGSGALEPINSQQVREQEEDRDEGDTNEPDERKGNTTVEVFRHLMSVQDLRDHPDKDRVEEREHHGNVVTSKDNTKSRELGDLLLVDRSLGFGTKSQDTNSLDGVGEVLANTVDGEHASDIQDNELEEGRSVG
jgi:hypothetical protein